MFVAQCIHDMTMSHGLAVSLFLAGLFGGFTHCAGMCAPFVLAQTGHIRKLRSALLWPYHLGRMTTYVTLAVLVNTVINLAFLFSDAKALIAVPLLLLAGVIFLVSAFPRLTVLFPWAARIRMAAPYKLITRFSSKLMNNPGVLKRYALGVLLGFIPCGLVVSALLASATAPGAMEAAVSMGAFAAGTMPALVLVALGGQIFKQRYSKAFTHMQKAAMVMSALWLFILAGNMVF